MLKLLKYDLKRNSNTLLSMFVLLIILQGIVTVTGVMREWDSVITVFLILLLYSVALLMVGIQSVNTYRNNIKSYNRRLVPVRPISHIVSSMVLGIAAELIILVIMILHGIIYSVYEGNLDRVISSVSVSFSTGLVMLLEFLLFFIFLYSAIVLSTTIAASVRGKIGTWIGILSFFLIQGALYKIETMLNSALGFPENYTFIFINEAERLSNSSGEAAFRIGGNFGAGLFTLTLDIVLITGMLFATTWLLRNKEQV
ncbi:hypothetical protein D3C77_303620 [compost metagenome]